MKKHDDYINVLLQNLLIALLFVFSGLLAEIWSIPESIIPPLLWPPTGTLLALILIWGYRIWPGAWLGGFLLGPILHWFSWKLWPAAVALGIGVAVQAIFSAWLLQKLTHTKTPFYKAKHVFIYTFIIAFLGSCIAPTLITLAFLSIGIHSSTTAEGYLLAWWFNDYVSVLVFTTIIMVWYKAKIILNRKQILEFAILLILLAIAIWMIYILQYPLSYLLIPFCVWAAVRFGLQLSIVVAFIIAALGALLEIYGYQQTLSPLSTIFLLQAFVAIVFFTTLMLCAILKEHSEAQSEIEQANEMLEQKVIQRTADLAKKNQELNTTLTTLKQAQTQLVQAEKMSSLGVLTAGIAHEINTPIKFIEANIPFLKKNVKTILDTLDKFRKISKDSFAKFAEITALTKHLNLAELLKNTHHIIARIEEEAKNTAIIVKDLRNFSRVQEGGLKKTDIHDNIDSTLTLLRSQYKDRITINKNYGDIPPIESFPEKLNQVFMNLLLNAIQAIPKQGTISITTEQIDDHITLTIQDTGIGMSPDMLAQIFEPFFTAHKMGPEHTGLGLTIVQNIIHDHHGTIEVKSELGKGSEFIITLPILQKLSK